MILSPLCEPDPQFIHASNSSWDATMSARKLGIPDSVTAEVKKN